MNTTLRHLALVALTVLAMACGDTTTPTAPTSANAGASAVVPPPSPPPNPVNFPPVSEPARIYVASHALEHPVQSYTLASRFVLYDAGTFALQYPFGEYRGTYTEADGLITFVWQAWSAAGPWGATGLLRDDTLSVRYNLIMQLDDFEDYVYVLKQ